jgi:ribonuclease E
MTKRILVDAVYEDETRVVVHENNIVQEFDYATATKKQFKGNIYLAKITRVEPSLQAAFVEYGANKHGFLPFSEIHPDYFQIPVSDRKDSEIPTKENLDVATAEQPNIYDQVEPGGEFDTEYSYVDKVSKDDVETLGENDDIEEGAVTIEEEIAAPKRPSVHRNYKIQEVIKRNQVILVQVIKEERGNKGASLTSYITLAGRYCVLMPNNDRLGGISRRIVDPDNRKRIKNIIEQLNCPPGVSVIVRTAGSEKSPEDIAKDYAYLLNLWNEIRSHTLTSVAPAFIHAEGDLMKRCIRDMYDETVDEIQVQGDDGYKTIYNFMKTVIPSDIHKLKLYKNKTPIFCRYRVEEQLTALYNQIVPLDSGGYVVINPTEALISIDVNSGKSTSERNVEETALKTNIEAAHEVARQLRLRDLSGLIVIDFIDMLDGRNRAAVERALRESLSVDRAKIQLGRISPFGLLEMSRQRLRPSFIEANTIPCSHCNGKGAVRSPESLSVAMLRTIESELYQGEYEILSIYAHPDAVNYVQNYKRNDLVRIEKRYGVRIFLHYNNQNSADSFSVEKATLDTSWSTVDAPAKDDDKSGETHKLSPKKQDATSLPGHRKNTPINKPRADGHRKRKRPSKRYNARDKKSNMPPGGVVADDQDNKGNNLELAVAEDSSSGSILKDFWKKIID